MNSEMFATYNLYLGMIIILVCLYKFVLSIFVFILVIKGIRYLNNKTRYDCATCYYKQFYDSESICNATKLSPNEITFTQRDG